MTRVIGVDASSTRLAAVILTDTHVEHTRIALPSDIEQACQRAYLWALDLVITDDIEPVDLVLVEAPFFHRQNPNGSVGLAQVNGALLAGFADVAVLSCQPSKWKKAVIGHGNATKQMIADHVSQQYPEVAETFVHHTGKTVRSALVLDQDLCDALCIALYAQSIAHLRNKRKHVRIVPSRRRRTVK